MKALFTEYIVEFSERFQDVIPRNYIDCRKSPLETDFYFEFQAEGSKYN